MSSPESELMTKLYGKQVSSFIQSLYLVSTNKPTNSFREWALTTIKEILPFRSVRSAK